MKIIRDAQTVAYRCKWVTSNLTDVSCIIFFNTNKEISVYSVFVSLMVVALAKRNKTDYIKRNLLQFRSFWVLLASLEELGRGCSLLIVWKD